LRSIGSVKERKSGRWNEADDAQSAILKAVAEKLIPGIPIQTRISILQQTSEIESNTGSAGGESEPEPFLGQFSVLETVIDRAISRNEIQYEINGKLHQIGGSTAY
jgi:hypothetical protein